MEAIKRFEFDIETPHNFITGSGPILLVDDDLGQQMIVKRCYGKSSRSNDLISFPNGQECLAYIEKAVREEMPFPECILIDINMPVMDGFELLEKIKEYENFFEVPSTIMFTASESEKDISRAQKIGANAYFSKPLNVMDYVKFFNNL